MGEEMSGGYSHILAIQAQYVPLERVMVFKPFTLG